SGSGSGVGSTNALEVLAAGGVPGVAQGIGRAFPECGAIVDGESAELAKAEPQGDLGDVLGCAGRQRVPRRGQPQRMQVAGGRRAADRMQGTPGRALADRQRLADVRKVDRRSEIRARDLLETIHDLLIALACRHDAMPRKSIASEREPRLQPRSRITPCRTRRYCP